MSLKPSVYGQPSYHPLPLYNTPKQFKKVCTTPTKVSGPPDHPKRSVYVCCPHLDRYHSNNGNVLHWIECPPCAVFTCMLCVCVCSIHIHLHNTHSGKPCCSFFNCFEIAINTEIWPKFGLTHQLCLPYILLHEMISLILKSRDD